MDETASRLVGYRRPGDQPVAADSRSRLELRATAKRFSAIFPIVRHALPARPPEGLNPRTQRQRQELYWFMLMSVGGALRAGDAYSQRWRDCELITLNDKNKTEAVHMMIPLSCIFHDLFLAEFPLQTPLRGLSSPAAAPPGPGNPR